MNSNSPPRILIVRLSAIGDVVHGMPVLCALRDHFPDAFLGWVVEGVGGDLLEGHAALDRLIRVPRKWLKSPRTVWQLRKWLVAERFDVAVDIQGLTKSAVAARLSGAARRIGFSGQDGQEISPLLNNERVTPDATHVIDRNLQLLAPLGIDRPSVRFDVPESAPAVKQISSWLRSMRATVPSQFALIHPAAGWPSKLWPTDRFAAVARHLGRQHGLPTLVAQGVRDGELQLARQVVDASEGHAHLVPPISLAELVALTRRARLFVGGDTGSMHLAAAVGTPTVTLFGPSDGQRNGAYGEGQVTLQIAGPIAGNRRRRTATNATMRAIDAARVAQACDTVLQQDRRSADTAQVA